MAQSIGAQSGSLTIQYVSDLHLEFSACAIPVLPNADVLVLAGDIHSDLHEGAQFVQRLQQCAPRPSGHKLHIVLVLGNHECYKKTYTDTVATMRQLYGDMENVHFLECDAVTILGVKFVGGALWCDPPPSAHFLIRHTIADFTRIKNWTLEACQKQCRETCRFIEAEARDQTVPVVVVTHFCPSLGSIHEKYQQRLNDQHINRYFATPLDDLITRCAPVAWIHGHTHSSMNYSIGEHAHDTEASVSGTGCRVLCNPRGYSSAPDKHPENGDFDPACCFTIPK
jgi:Icc-related predicted phosphoesterase